VGFCDLGDVFVGVGVVDFVEGDDGGEFLVGEGFNDAGDGFAGPVLEGLFEAEFVERAGDDLRRGAVAGELVLERFDCGGFYGYVAPFYGAPGVWVELLE
jgi:hypothetical protein